jgi:acetyl esterase/lipase
MRKTSGTRSRNHVGTLTAGAFILFVLLLPWASPAIGAGSGRPPKADAGPSRPSAAVRPTPETLGIRVLEHVSYGIEAPQAQMLNAYLLQRDNAGPAIVQILSGGWNSAPPRTPNLGPFKPYFDAGFSVIAVAHRPIGPDTHWPAPGDDIARAIQFIRAHAKEWGIDPNRIAVKGRSSGGHLALMVGFGPDRADPTVPDPVQHQSSRPNCLVAGAAPTDLVQQMSALLQGPDRQSYLWGRILALVGGSADGMSREELLGKLRRLSPIEYVTRDSPPVFLTCQGPTDAFWPGDARLKWDVHTPITSLILEKKLREWQVPYELVISPESTRGDATLQRRELAFLARHLRLTAGPPGGLKSPVRPTPHYSLGAKFEPPAGRVVHGMGQWEQYNAKLLPLVPAELRPGSKLIFIDLGDTPRGWRPEAIRNLVQRCDQEGFIPHLDIAPRGNQPGRAALAALADPLFGIDDEVASTSRFDERIQDLVGIVKEFGKPVIVRIGGEFNGRWNGYHPYAYPRAFRKIVEMFRAAGADNAAFVWCYEPAAPGDFDERNDGGQYKWFPGDDVVDWFAIDWFNQHDFTGPLTGGRRGENAMTAHGRSRKFLDMAVSHHKPVMIAESAPCRYDLSDPAQAESAWRRWFEPYFAILAERSEIKWFHLISYNWSRAAYFAQTGWRNNDFTASPILLQKLLAELRKAKYLHADEKTLLKDYARFAAVPRHDQ